MKRYFIRLLAMILLLTVTALGTSLTVRRVLAADSDVHPTDGNRHPQAVVYRSDNWGKKYHALKAVKLALRGKHGAAQKKKAKLDDAAARTLIDWLWITDPNGTKLVPLIQRFIYENPNWPDMKLIRSRLERFMHAQDVSTAESLIYFEKNPPLTPTGQFIYAKALKNLYPEKAGKLAKTSYRTHRQGVDFSKKLIRDFADWISDEDRFIRLSRLIINHETTKAKKNAVAMGKPFTQVTDAAHKLLTQAKNAEKAKLALPLRYRYQPALQYALARYYKRQAENSLKSRRSRKNGKKSKKAKLRHEKYRVAMKAMLRASLGHKELPKAEKWWRERRGIIHTALSSKKPMIDGKLAYELAANHGLISGKYLPDAEWMAGWIAFRRLKDSSKAAAHFKRSLETSIRMRDKSRAHYWLARALEALGQRDGGAMRQDRLAAGYGFTYYGLLGAGKSGGFVNGKKLPPSAISSIQAVMLVRKSERLKALQLLVKAGANRKATLFAQKLASDARTANELAVTMDAVKSIGGLPLAMKVAREGAWGGHYLGLPSYPTDPLPRYKHLSEGAPERALVLAIARQESEFDASARSHVGARGFMQIMPSTGRWLCKIHGMRCSARHLIEKPALNVQLGSAFLYQLVDEWNGSYIMAAASYNAGSSRIEKWNDAVGDPRKGKISPIDWVELIPFSETRNYVKRVLRNIQIYRRILEPENELTMLSDLNRGRFLPLKTARTELCNSKHQLTGDDAKCVRQD